jgi:phytoene desaturase
MNYADIKLGTWYPMGGMNKIIEGMIKLAKEKSVDFNTGQEVKRIEVMNNMVSNVVTDHATHTADVVIAGADYHHVDSTLLEPVFRNYKNDYWSKKVMAPSAVVFYVGVDKKIKNLLHHNLFFDADFSSHVEEIYSSPSWPEEPLFYTCVPSKTDPSVAPKGMENLFILIPVASGMEESEEIIDRYFKLVIRRIEKYTGEKISDHIIFKRSFARKNFIADYNSFKGNAYGMANTLMQTAFLRPKLKSKKVKNLYFTGQLTVPGPGVPPSLISGKLVSDLLNSEN